MGFSWGNVWFSPENLNNSTDNGNEYFSEYFLKNSRKKKLREIRIYSYWKVWWWLGRSKYVQNYYIFPKFHQKFRSIKWLMSVYQQGFANINKQTKKTDYMPVNSNVLSQCNCILLINDFRIVHQTKQKQKQTHSTCIHIFTL